MSGSDQLKLPAVQTTLEDASVGAPADRRAAGQPRASRAVPMLWRVFAASASVFALAFALLVLSPIEIHARIRLTELVLLLAGLVVMLVLDLLLLRQALAPLARLAKLMGTINLRRPGRRAVGFERSSTEVLALAQAFNEMLERLEDERRKSSARVLAAQEAERMRLARELHDEIGQTLTAVALRAEHTAQRVGNQHAEFAELAEVVQHSLADVRRISLELRPGALEQLGLLNALISLCERVSEQSGIRVNRQLEGPAPRLPPEVELAIYRIAQEALTNAMRHSHAAEVTVSLAVTDRELMLSVADNGRGMPGDVIEGGGLAGMRERALLIGAELRIEQTPAGVTVTLRLPLNHEGVS